MLVAAIGSAFLICSCTVQDTTYARGASSIKDMQYPPNRIVGVWANVEASFTGDPKRGETKTYYEILPNGRGQIRQFSLYRSTGHFIDLEAAFSWQYLGNNRWRILLPPSTAYRVLRNNGVNMGYVGARDATVRYAGEKLYCTASRQGFQIGQAWVRATAENVSDAAKRARSEAPVIKFGGGVAN